MSQASFGNITPRGPQMQGQMSNHLPTMDSEDHAAGSAVDYHSTSRSTSKSPLQASIGWFKGLSSGDRRNRDGQLPKRRGPKPDSKPALTRRQELNRLAQRTHRERKETYIKSLEQEVMQLKENYTGTIQEKNAVVEENRKLRNILAMHGIALDSTDATAAYATTTGVSIPTAFSFQANSGFSPQSQQLSSDSTSPVPFIPEIGLDAGQNQPPQPRQPQPPPPQALDFNQLGVDFVLTSVSQGHTGYAHPLESGCTDHLRLMLDRSLHDPSHPMAQSLAADPVPHPHGHALMWSCPPHSELEGFSAANHEHRMPDISNEELMKLFNLSKGLPLNGDGEITPVIALGMIMDHERVSEMTVEDWKQVTEQLRTKIRCYGFGAVLEEFELRDALEALFSTKIGPR